MEISWPGTFFSFLSAMCTVTFFELGNYNGVETHHREESDEEKWRKKLYYNDDMSSLTVSQGCCVILYKDINYGGDSRKVCSNMKQSQLGEEWNNVVSSIKFTNGRYSEVSDSILGGCGAFSVFLLFGHIIWRVLDIECQIKWK